MKAFLLDKGILLTREDKEFENYNIVYDKKYGYYDEDQYYVQIQDDAIKQAKQYVIKGNENVYAIVSETVLNDDIDLENACVENEEYITNNIIYSIAKINGKVVENFIDKTKSINDKYI